MGALRNKLPFLLLGRTSRSNLPGFKNQRQIIMKKNLLIISTVYHPYQIGGAEISTQLLAEELTKYFNVFVLTHGLVDEDFVLNGVTVVRRFFGAGSKAIINECRCKKTNFVLRAVSKWGDLFGNRRVSKVFSKVLERIKPTYIVYSGGCSRMGRKTLIDLGYKRSIKQIYIIRDPSFLYFKSLRKSLSLIDTIYSNRNKKTLERIGAVVGITDSILRYHESAGFVFKKRYVIPNIVGTEKTNCIHPSLKKKNVLYVGAISKNKGVDFLIDSFLRASSIPRETKLVLVGGLVDVRVPKNNRVVYLGKKDKNEVHKLMAENYVVVLPSVWAEAFGRVLVEASNNSTLAIGSDSGGIPEVLGFDDDYIFKSLSEDDLLTKINRVLNLSDIEYLSALEHQQKLFEKFNAHEVGNQFLDLFRSIEED